MNEQISRFPRPGSYTDGFTLPTSRRRWFLHCPHQFSIARYRKGSLYPDVERFQYHRCITVSKQPFPMKKHPADQECSLFAIPLPINTTYWAYGFPAMCIAVSGVDTLYPSLTLFTAHSLPPEDQALGGGLINAVAQVGRAIGLAVGTAMQVAVQANREGATVQAVQKSPLYHNLAFLDGIRTVAWFDFAFGVVGFIVVVLFLRGAGKIGAVKK